MADLRELVDELDRLVPKDGAKLKMPADPDGNTTVGTQRGYLRLGVELLRAGLSPIDGPPPEIPRIPLDIAYLLTSESKTPFELCETVERVEELQHTRRLGAVGQLLTAVVAVLVIGLVFIGAAVVISWLRR